MHQYKYRIIEFSSDLKGNYKSVEYLIDIADDVMYKIKSNKKSKT